MRWKSRSAPAGQVWSAPGALLTVAMMAGVLSAPTVVRALDIVRNGAAATAIIIPNAELPVEAFAAMELQYHIKQATGATVGVFHESQVPAGTGGYIYIGATQAAAAAGVGTAGFAPNAFTNQYRAAGDNVFLRGGDSAGNQLSQRTHAGSMFGVYDFLETQLGVKWLWPGAGGEVIPTRSSLSVNSLNKNAAPALAHTSLRATNAGMSGPGFQSTRARDSYIHDQAVWLRRQRMAQAVDLSATHAFTDYWSRFGSTNPEFFQQLPDGTRRPDPNYFGGAPQLTSMNVSSTGLHNQIVQEWLNTRTALAPYIDISENDTPGKDMTAASLAWDVRDPTMSDSQWNNRVALATQAFHAGEPNWERHLGSLSDRYARSFLEVLNLAKQSDPDAKVIGLAYQNYTKPPIATQLNEDVIVTYTAPLMYPWTSDKRQTVRDWWAGWADSGAAMVLRPNYMLDGHNLPIYFANEFAEDFAFTYARRMVGTDFDSLTGQWATQGPNLYLAARIQSSPHLTANQILDEYYSAFGPAKAAVQQYFDHWRQVSASVPADVWESPEALARDAVEPGHYSEFYKAADVIFTRSVMNEGRDRIGRAAVAARSDPAAKQRVAFLEKGYLHAELTLATQEMYRRYQQTGQIEPYRTTLKALRKFRASVESENVANMGWLGATETSTWDYSLAVGGADFTEPKQLSYSHSQGQGLTASDSSVRPAIGQSFIPFLPLLTGVAVNYTGEFLNNPTEGASLTLDIFAASGGVDGYAPMGSSLGSSTLLLSSLDADPTVREQFTFDIPIAIALGREYFFQLTLDAPEDTGYISFALQALSDTYGVGSNLVFEGGSWRYHDGSTIRDLEFQVFQSTYSDYAGPIPEPSALSVMLMTATAALLRRRRSQLTSAEACG